MDNGNSNKKAKGTKNCVIKRILKFNNYKNAYSRMKPDQNHNKDLKLDLAMYILKKSTRFH